MKELSHAVFNTAFIYYIMSAYLHISSILLLIFIAISSSMLNYIIDRFGHEKFNSKIVRNRIIHSFELLVIAPSILIALAIYNNIAKLLLFILLLNLPLHALLDLFNKNGIYSFILREGISLADIHYDSIPANLAIIAISSFILYIAFS